MSAAKFASITSGLLARKGEAKPWTEPEKKPLPWHAPERLAIPAVIPVTNLPPHGEKIVTQRKCAVRMSPQEYEQLGILAVKKDCTRQQLLREALGQLLAAMAQEYPQCPCLRD